MSEQQPQYCPCCQDTAVQAVVSACATTLVQGGSDGDPPMLRRNLYCTACQEIWSATEAPTKFVDELLSARESVESMERQIAMLRLLLAQRRCDQPATAMASLSSLKKGA